jgi:hypothetical protein
MEARMAGFKSNVLDRWPAGTKLSVQHRITDSYMPNAEVVKSVSVPKDGELSVSGLEEGWQYWLASDDRQVAFTAKEAQQRPVSALAAQTEALGGPASAAPGRATEPNVITGARKSSDVRARHQSVLLDEDRKVVDPEPQPHVNQLDAKGPQRSDTAFGEATPVDPKEIQPRPGQEDVGKRTPQRSDTEFGEATPVARDEVEPFISQEDVPKGVRQRSDTELGQAEPVTVQSARPSKPKARDAEKRRASSEAKAAGSTEQQSSEQVSKKALKDSK